MNSFLVLFSAVELLLQHEDLKQHQLQQQQQQQKTSITDDNSRVSQLCLSIINK